VALGRFVSATEALVKVSKRTPSAVRSVGADTTFRAAKLTLTKAQEIKVGTFTPANADADEYKAYQQNGDNPAIRKQQ